MNFSKAAITVHALLTSSLTNKKTSSSRLGTLMQQVWNLFMNVRLWLMASLMMLVYKMT